MTEIRALAGASLDAALDDVAALRISVFRDWRYLYDGDLGYERRYLQSYRDSERAILVGAFNGGRLVGAATGTPLANHADEFAGAFAGTGIDMDQIFYCAESVLLPQYRGHGVGHRFFDLREAHARALGFDRVAFCAVARPSDHPLRPESSRTLGALWRGRGYQPMPGVIATFSWKNLHQNSETRKSLQFWMRTL